MGRYIELDDLEAEDMFERLLGYSYAVAPYVEDHKFQKKLGSQIKLDKEPIKIESCLGLLDYDLLKIKGWYEIPLEMIVHQGRVLDIPPAVFGVPYRAVRVRYTAGHAEIPADIKATVVEISNLLAKESVSTWNLPLSHEALTTINKYQTKHEGGNR